MMLVDGPNEVYAVDRDNTVFHIPNLRFPRRKDLSAHIRETLMDGVIIGGFRGGDIGSRFRTRGSRDAKISPHILGRHW